MAWSLIFEYKGDLGQKNATSEIFLPQTFSLVQYGLFAVAMAEIINDFVKGQIVSATLSIGLDVSALTGNTNETDSDVQEVGGFEFLAEDGFVTKVNLPTFPTSLTVAGTEQIDIADTDVDAFVEAMLTGIAVTGGTIQPSDVGELDIEELIFAEYQNKNSGNNG